MSLKHASIWFVLAFVIPFAIPLPAVAVVPLTVPPLPQRIALADVVVVGKVTKIEDALIDASPPLKIPGVPKTVSYHIADVALASILVGPKDLSQLRVAFQVAPKAGLPQGQRRRGHVQLVAKQEGCFILRKHPDESFYVLQEGYEFLDKAVLKDFDMELAQVERCASLLNEPNAGLKSKEGKDRFLTAALLIFRYRTPQVVYRGDPVTDAIEAEQSKRILTVLAEADWSEKDLPSPMSPLALFLRLGLTEKDGWKMPDDLKQTSHAARQWLKEQSASYRIRRYVSEEPTEKAR